MSKWTKFQVGVAVIVCAVILLINTYYESVRSVLKTIDEKWVPAGVIILFITVLFVVWMVALLFYFQERKGKPLFTHKIWRVVPAMIGVSLVVTFILFVMLGLTVLQNVDASNQWIVNLMVILFLTQVYMLILSIYVRYNERKTNREKILSSANATVLLLLVILFFIPGL